MPENPPARFSVTIVSLGDFEASGYEAALWEWARSSLRDWGASIP